MSYLIDFEKVNLFSETSGKVQEYKLTDLSKCMILYYGLRSKFYRVGYIHIFLFSLSLTICPLGAHEYSLHVYSLSS